MYILREKIPLTQTRTILSQPKMKNYIGSPVLKYNGVNFFLSFLSFFFKLYSLFCILYIILTRYNYTHPVLYT